MGLPARRDFAWSAYSAAMTPRRIVHALAGIVLVPLVVLGCAGGAGSNTAACVPASAALIENINLSMNDPADAIEVAYVSPATNLEGPPVVDLLEDPVWVAAAVPGSAPALFLAEGSGHGFAYVANGAAEAINYSGIDLGGPPLDGDGKEPALACAV
jgi:hypothetical protein